MGKKIGYIIITVLIGGQFLFSAYSKLDTIEQFEIILVQYGIGDWFWSKIIARILISYEFVLGVLLCAQIKFGTMIKKVTLATLIFFSLFVLYQMFAGARVDNCGCFGELVELTPEQTLLKNGISIGLLILAFMLTQKSDWLAKKWRVGSTVILSLVAIGFVVILQPPIDVYGQSSPKAIEDGGMFPALEIYDSEAGNPIGVDSSWYKGKNLIVFVSAGCKYCKQVVSKVNVVYDDPKYKDRILLVFVFETDATINDFLQRTGGEKFATARIDKKRFIKVTKGRYPQLFYLSDGVVEANIGKKELFEFVPEF